MRRVARILSALVLLAIASAVAALVVLAWLQPDSATLPEPTGSHRVGRTRYDWLDGARIDPLAPAPGTKRELPVWIWYPAVATGTTRAAYMSARQIEALAPEGTGLVRRALAFVFDGLTANRAKVTVHAIDDAGLPPGHERFPVVLLKPARGASTVQYTSLAEDLASHGYVVVGSDSPHTTAGVAYTDGRVVRRSPAGAPSESAPGRRSDLAPGQPNDLALPVTAVWVDDNRFLVNRLEALNASNASRFAGRLDLAAVGALGHSYGGAAALQFCAEDQRCKAGVDIDGAPLGSVVMRGIDKPFLFFVADRPGFDTPAGQLRTDEQALFAAFQRLRTTIPSTPGLLRLRESRHYNFSDQALLSEPHLWRFVGAIGAIDPTRAIEVTRRYVRAFFDTHLKGGTDPLIAGPSPDYPEVRFP
jgi:dienelactone hydrolase